MHPRSGEVLLWPGGVAVPGRPPRDHKRRPWQLLHHSSSCLGFFRGAGSSPLTQGGFLAGGGTPLQQGTRRGHPASSCQVRVGLA